MNRADFWHSLPSPFTVLAPMEGITDVVFRQVVAKAGRPDVFFTEFTNVSSFTSEKGQPNALERLTTTGSESPIVAQIWGNNPEHFAKTAAALEDLGFDGLDINMGCPDRHVNKAGGGAAMITTPDLAIECITKAKSASNLPVSVKTRLGYTFRDEYLDWIPLLLNQKLAALTVHLRTRKEMSKVPAHYDLIPSIVQLRDEISPETILIINGDIADLATVHKLSTKYPAVNGYMIGRGVFKNPFCFTTHQASRAELRELFLYHLDLFDKRASELSQHGSFYPYEPIKHFIKIYFSSYDGAADLRAKLMECKNTSELRATLNNS